MGLLKCHSTLPLLIFILNRFHLGLLSCLVFIQGRQKLALFNAKEFATLIIDILNDARRREQDSNPDLTQGIKLSFLLTYSNMFL